MARNENTMTEHSEMAGELARIVIGTGYEHQVINVCDSHRIAQEILAAGYRKTDTGEAE